jgi:hypothetical protein
MNIQVEGTPNPSAVKFVLDSKALGPDSRSYFSADEATGDALASRLFQVPGVRALFLVDDFITVTRTEDAVWDDIVEEVLCAIREELE